MEEVMIIEEKKLKKAYMKKNDSVLDTAAELRVSVQTVMASLKKYKIDFVKPKHLYSDLKKTDFSDFQKSLLIGSVLGDGHLEKRSHLKNASFREEHSVGQTQWLKWKHNNLKPFTTMNTWIRDRGDEALMPDGHGGKKMYKISNVIAMSTNIHPYLTYLHNQFYVNRVKIVPAKLIKNNFDIISMAVLIGDDGSLNGTGIVICTESFKYDEVVLLKEAIEKLFKGSVKVNGLQAGKPRLYLSKFDKDPQFVSKIKNILPKCMHYKLPTVLNEHQTATQSNE